MHDSDGWLRRLARRETLDSVQSVTDEALATLFAELRRCVTVFNYHTTRESAAQVFVNGTHNASIIYQTFEVTLAYNKERLSLALNTIEQFREHQHLHEEFQPTADTTGVFYWQNKHDHSFSNDMLVRRIFAMMTEYTPD